MSVASKGVHFKVEGDLNQMAYIAIVIGVITVLVLIFGLVVCNRASPTYVIDIDRLMDADPERCDQLLTEMVRCRLSATNYSQIGDVVSTTYEIVDGIVNESGSFPRIVIGFNEAQRSENINVFFGEYVDRMKALQRVGFKKKDLFDAGHGPYRLTSYTKKAIYLIYEREEFTGGLFAVPNVEWKKRYWINWTKFDDGRNTGISARFWVGKPVRIEDLQEE